MASKKKYKAALQEIERLQNVVSWYYTELEAKRHQLHELERTAASQNVTIHRLTNHINNLNYERPSINEE